MKKVTDNQIFEFINTKLNEITAEIDLYDICGVVSICDKSMIYASLLAIMICKPLFVIKDGQLIKLSFQSEHGGTRMNDFINSGDKLLAIDCNHVKADIKKIKKITGTNLIYKNIS